MIVSPLSLGNLDALLVVNVMPQRALPKAFMVKFYDMITLTEGEASCVST